MKHQPPELRPIDPRTKRQIIVAVLLGLIGGSILIFVVVWSSTKQKMEELKQQKQEAVIEQQDTQL